MLTSVPIDVLRLFALPAGEIAAYYRPAATTNRAQLAKIDVVDSEIDFQLPDDPITVSHTAAFNLFNAMRDDEHLPERLPAGQPCTSRTRVIKMAAKVTQSVRRIMMELSACSP